MDDRYEIKGKIGQGGIGAVYRAFDTRMNREVAIKRIHQDSSKESPEQQEATRQMTKEAGALASLQHPHIVTVYDVGLDEDGPYVVMELLTGKTLDELAQNAPLTAQDFREFALQTQEALIAAQDLGIVHRDLKPGNVMLTWLPSGKFQVKIVDFGLAKFSAKPSLQTLDHQDSIYGSIFFMAPEQFERVPLDSRTDMYAIGCVYYFALTGKNPFDGETGPQVMASHLNHLVVPLNEVRPDLPQWLCDWVMWHINRQPADRPTDARQSLQIFLQNDSASNLSVPPPPAPAPAPAPAAPQQVRPRIQVPGAAPAAPEPAVTPHTAPQPIVPPEGSKPSVHTTSVPIAPTVQAEPAPVAAVVPTGPITSGGRSATQAPTRRPAIPAGTQPPARPQVAPQKAAAAPQQAQATAKAASNTQQMAQATQKAKGSATRPGQPGPPPKKPKSATKTILISTLSSLLILGGIIGFVVYKSIMKAKKEAEFILLVEQINLPDIKEIPINKEDFARVLSSAQSNPNLGERQKMMKVLSLAKSTDGENLDARIVATAIDPATGGERREEFFREVIAIRKSPDSLPALMDFIATSTDEASIASAINAAAPHSGDAQFATYLNILKKVSNEQTRRAAEEAIAQILKSSPNAAGMKTTMKELYSTTVNGDLQRSLKKLLGN